MSDVFVSYARSSERQAHQVAEVLRAQGYRVWRDDELPAHRSYSDVIEERLRSAKAVIVVWSSDAVSSQWVRAEADVARQAGTLVQVTVDGSMPPLPFNQIQCADLSGWSGETDGAGWKKVADSVASLVGVAEAYGRGAQRAPAKRVAICVLPFINMSGDAEQEYFSDGISEDIITDLSKVSALTTLPRNTAFTFKGQVVDVTTVAKQLNVTHVLEGSVRKAGSRVRITAELIDCANEQLWAERYDRDLNDIFAIQDEISKAIVAALKLKLLPQEKKAIEKRGTTSAEAYNLYLMARQQLIGGSFGDPRRDETIVRICQQATLLDPDYAYAWALMAFAQSELRFWHGKDVNALPAAERALAIDPNIAEVRCIKARYFEEEGRQEEANSEIEAALKLDPDSWEVNREAARMMFREGRTREAVPFFEKAASLMDTDWHNSAMLVTCYQALGDEENLTRAARMTLDRAQATLSQDPTNGAAIAVGAMALAMFGEHDRAREWIQRALLLDPDNLSMRYNLACVLVTDLRDTDRALDVLEQFFENVESPTHLKHLQRDPDLDPLRDLPRFKQMLEVAKQRLGVLGKTPG